MKRYFVNCLFVFLCANGIFAQISIQKGKTYRWISIKKNPANVAIFNEESLNSAFISLYQKVESNQLKLQRDTLVVGDFGAWTWIPDVKYFMAKNSPEIYYTQYAIDFVTVTKHNDQFRKDEYGNFILKFDSNGNQQYVFENERRALQAIDLNEILVLEEGKWNRKTQQLDYEIKAISFQSEFLMKTTWIDWKDFLNLEGVGGMNPFVKLLTTHNYHGFQYRQESKEPLQENTLLGKQWIKVPNNNSNSILFDRKILNQLAILTRTEKLKIHFRYSGEEWVYPWEVSNFDIFLKDTARSMKASRDEIQFLAKKGMPIVDENGDPIDDYDANGNPFTRLEPTIYLYVNASKIEEIRIHEVIKYDAIAGKKVFVPNAIIFVGERNGILSELFLVKIDELIQAEDKIAEEPWLTFILDKKYRGYQFHQSM
ncbi:MAG: hypothetical protein WC044_09690 [Crocinitomicaceae bacterium]